MRYSLAKCCRPGESDAIVAFLRKDEDVFSVHRADCVNISKVPADRLVTLEWSQIVQETAAPPPVLPDSVVDQLDRIDLAILVHHRQLGPDYAAAVAWHVQASQEEVFTRHRKLRDLRLLRRIEPRMLRYRKGVVDGKWIKHRNHTYYELTDLGRELVDSAAPEDIG